MERMLARRTTRLVAVGTRVRDELLDAGIGTPDQYLVVPPGVQLPAPPARGAARRALGLPQGAPVVAFVARFTRVKRPDRFIDVARVLSADHPDIVFVVAGDGAELPATVSAATDAGLGQQIRFLGWRPDVETIYAASDVTVLTSDNEGMPVSLIEAAMSGCPAVTTDVGSAAEVVLDGKTGFVTSPEPIDLARAVSRILADADLRDRLARAAVAHAMERFSRRRLARDLTKLYEELALDKGFACVSS